MHDEVTEKVSYQINMPFDLWRKNKTSIKVDSQPEEVKNPESQKVESPFKRQSTVIKNPQQVAMQRKASIRAKPGPIDKILTKEDLEDIENTMLIFSMAYCEARKKDIMSQVNMYMKQDKAIPKDLMDVNTRIV